MPAVRGVWSVHPVTSAPGIWLELSSNPPGTITGVSTANLAIAVLTTGETTATYSTKASAHFQSTFCRRRLKLAASDPDARNPPPGVSYDAQTGELVIDDVIVTITFTSLSPLTVNAITVSEGAAREVRVTGGTG